MTTPNEGFTDTLLKSSADGALSAISEVGDRAATLVDAWVREKNADAVAEVAARGNGAARKAARRGLNVLKSRGVPVPERKRTATLGGATDAPVIEAWMMAPDATGAELFAISSRAGTSRARVCLVFLHQQRGIARVDTRTLSQSGLKEYFDGVLPGAGYGPIKVPLAWARYRIAMARKLHADAGVPEPMGFSSNRELVEGAPAEPPPHPFDEEGFELSDEDARALAKDSADLHRLPEFRSWLPTSQAMQDMLVQVGQKLRAGEEPDPEEVSSHLGKEVEAATDRYFSPQVREQIVALMKDAALSVLSREGESAALEIAAAMKAIGACGLITDPPHEVPFLRAFFDKAIAAMAQQGGGRLRIPVPRVALDETAPGDAIDASGEGSAIDASGAAESESASGAGTTMDASGAAESESASGAGDTTNVGSAEPGTDAKDG